MEERLKTGVMFGKMDTVEGVPYLEMKVSPSTDWSFITVKEDRLIITDNLVTVPSINTADIKISNALYTVPDNERIYLVRDIMTTLIMGYMIRFRPQHYLQLDWDLVGVGSDAYTDFIKSVIDMKGKEKPTPRKVYLKYGDLTFDEKYGNCPTLEVRTRIGNDGPEKTFGYITAFRGYFFQISETYDGQRDLASYRAGHGTMMSCFDSCSRVQKEEIYRTMLFSTLLQCLTNAYGSEFHPSSSLLQEWREGSPIKEFIDKSIDWVETYIKR